MKSVERRLPISRAPRIVAGIIVSVAAVCLGANGARGEANAPQGAGQRIYAERCATCHGSALQGAGGPPLAGITFAARWSGREASELYKTISTTMPLNAVGGLSADQYRQVYELILTVSGMSAGSGILKQTGPAQIAAGPDPVLPAAPKFFGRAVGSGPSDAELARAADGDWLMYNRDYRGQRFSALDQITPGNVRKLAPSCLFQAGEGGSFETSPIVYRNRIYITTTHDTYAVDATTCRKIWEHSYTPAGAEGLPVNRGAALYAGKILRGTPDGHIIALDAATGGLLWDVWVANSLHGYNINGALIAFGGKVYAGEGGADRGATGHIYAFDAETGKLVWTFDPVPTGKAPGAETWSRGAEVGGGSSWTTITVDPRARLLYVPIGNPGADIDGAVRPGDNLYTDSIVVLKADTGRLVWYAQQEPHDTHDWDTAAAPAIYDLDGRRLMAVATKGGWLYLYDLATRKLVSKSEIDMHLNAEQPLVPGVELRVCPGTLGGAEWNGPAFDPKNRMLFVNSVDWCGTFKTETAGRNTFGGSLKFDPYDKATGWIHGFDARTGQMKWSRRTDGPMVAGLTPTATGLVFTGTPSGEFWALDGSTGDILYRFNTGGAIAGGISSYAVDGKQYLAVTSGSASRTIWNTTGAPTLIVFSLPDETQ